MLEFLSHGEEERPTEIPGNYSGNSEVVGKFQKFPKVLGDGNFKSIPIVQKEKSESQIVSMLCYNTQKKEKRETKKKLESFYSKQIQKE